MPLSSLASSLLRQGRRMRLPQVMLAVMPIIPLLQQPSMDPQAIRHLHRLHQGHSQRIRIQLTNSPAEGMPGTIQPKLILTQCRLPRMLMDVQPHLPQVNTQLQVQQLLQATTLHQMVVNTHCRNSHNLHETPNNPEPQDTQVRGKVRKPYRPCCYYCVIVWSLEPGDTQFSKYLEFALESGNSMLLMDRVYFFWSLWEFASKKGSG